MNHEDHEHWPLIPDHEALSNDEAERLLEEIRVHAFAIHDRLAAQGHCQSPQDDWLVAQAEVLARRGCATSP